MLLLQRNCPKYLAEKKDDKVKGILDIHVIDVYLTNAHSSARVFDTGLVANICNLRQGLRIKGRLAKDEVTMRVGNGSKVDVITVVTLPLHLPSGLVLDLNNCYLVPALSMNIISGSCLMRDGYSFKSKNNGCSIYMSNCSDPTSDGQVSVLKCHPWIGMLTHIVLEDL